MNRLKALGALAAGVMYALTNFLMFGVFLASTSVPLNQALPKRNRWLILGAALVTLAFIGAGPRGAFYTIIGILAIVGGIIGAVLVIGARSLGETR